MFFYIANDSVFVPAIIPVQLNLSSEPGHLTLGISPCVAGQVIFHGLQVASLVKCIGLA